MVYIAYYSEIDLQICTKMTDLSRIRKYAVDERIRGIFASVERLPTSATLNTVILFTFLVRPKIRVWGLSLRDSISS